MKIRSGFVSNSSSSSFILVGVCLNETEARKLLGAGPQKEGDDMDLIDYDGKEFDVQCDYENDQFYIGDVKQYGEGFYGGENFAIDDFIKQITTKSEKVEKLKAKGYDPRLYITTISG